MTEAERKSYQKELDRLIELQCKTFLHKKGDYVKKTHKRIEHLKKLLKGELHAK